MFIILLRPLIIIIILITFLKYLTLKALTMAEVVGKDKVKPKCYELIFEV